MNSSQSKEVEFSRAFLSTAATCLEVTVFNVTLISAAVIVRPTALASYLATPSSANDVSSESVSESTTWMTGHRTSSASANEGSLESDKISDSSSDVSGVTLTYSVTDNSDIETVQKILSGASSELTKALVRAGYDDAIVSNVVSVILLDTIALIQNRGLGSGEIATIALAGIALTFMALVLYGKKHSKVTNEDRRAAYI